MGLLSGIDAVRKVQKMKHGGSYKLSAAQISAMLVNLPDAKKNLAPDAFSCVEKLFQLYQAETEMKYYNLEQYLEKAADIVARFNAFAPYEKYSGGGTAESMLLIRSIRDFDAQKMFRDYSEKADELDLLSETIKHLEDTLKTARESISGCTPKSEIKRLVSIGEIGTEVLDAYEVQEQVVSCTPSMIEATKKRMEAVQAEMSKILTGC